MFIVTKKIDSENISKVCRTCLREDNDKMMFLFVGPAKSSLGAKLQSLSCLKVSQGDGLPEKMCDKCVIRAESALLFREQCRAAEKALKQALLTTASNCSNQTYAPGSCTNHTSDQLNQSFQPLPNSFTSSCYSSPSSSFYSSSSMISNNNKVAKDYQDSTLSNQFYHRPVDQKLNYVPQQLHIKSCASSYLNFNYSNSHDLNQLVAENNHLHYTKYCTSQCMLCNHTFSNKIQSQSINYNIAFHKENYVNLCDTNISSEKISNDNNRVRQEKQVDHLNQQSSEFMPYEKTFKYNNMAFDHLNLKNQFQDENNTIPNHHKLVKRLKNKELVETKLNITFKCEICHLTFNKKFKLIAHQVIHNSEKPFHCPFCRKSYSSKSKLSAHVRLHTHTNVHQCNICKKTFAYPSYLRDHMKSHYIKQVRQTDFECSLCKKRFLLARSYTRHMKFHTGRALYHCDVCNKLYSHKNALKIHMKSHENLKIHECHICNKSFNQKSNLIEHIRTHTKVKPFKCKICDKSFVQSSHLKSHQASHDSTRGYQCRQCGKNFKLSSHLKRHANSHLALKMHKCDECNQMFSQSYSLRRHIKRKHKQ